MLLEVVGWRRRVMKSAGWEGGGAFNMQVAKKEPYRGNEYRGVDVETCNKNGFIIVCVAGREERK